MSGLLPDLRTPAWIVALLSCGCRPPASPSHAPRGDEGQPTYAIRGPCDSPDPAGACTQRSSSTLYFRMETVNASGAAARALLALGPDVEAIEACHREAARDDRELACGIQLTVQGGAAGAQHLALDGATTCPAALARCVLAAARPVDPPVPLASDRAAPAIMLSLGPRLPEDPRSHRDP